MSEKRLAPQARQNLHTWRYYNENFNPDRHHPLAQNLQNVVPPSKLQQPPPTYKKAMQQSFNSKRKPITTTNDQTFWEKALMFLDYYCDTSSLHGLKYVGENRFSKAERFFWFVAFLAAVIFAIYFISQLYIRYDNSPVIVGFSPEMINVQNIPFPAVTICNTNVAFKSRVEVVKREGTAVQQSVIDDLCDSNSSTFDNIDSISWKTMEGVILNITQLCTEMIVGCKWQGKTYVCTKLFNSVFTDDGYCCNFNRLPNSYIFRNDDETRPRTIPEKIIDWFPEYGYPEETSEDIFPHRAFGRGAQQGLTLVLDAALKEYYCSTINSFGFKVMFHSPREAPKIANLGFLIPPGTETRIAIDADVTNADDSIRGIDYRKRKCFFAYEKYLRYYKVYNARNCLQECEANFTLVKCGCTPYYLPRDTYTKVCDKSDQNCTDAAQFQIERFGHEKVACECLPGCAQIEYSPGIQSEAKLMNINNITFTEFLGNRSQEYFAENMAVVHIFFGAERYSVQVTSALYTFSEFLSNTGGLLGLFLGFSFLSVVEIIFFLFIRGPCLWCQNRRNKTKQTMFFQ